MHQHGVGLRQDFHLAKRFFDSSAQTHPDARWPVNLALVGLYLHWWYSGEKGGITDKPIVRTAGRPDDVLLDSVGAVAEARKAVARWRARFARVWDRLVPALEEDYEEEGEEEGVGGLEWDWEAWAEAARRRAPAVDTVLIGVLTVALWYVLRVRAEQRAARRRQRELQQGQGQGASVPAAGAGAREHQD